MSSEKVDVWFVLKSLLFLKENVTGSEPIGRIGTSGFPKIHWTFLLLLAKNISELFKYIFTLLLIIVHFLIDIWSNI